MRKVRLQMAQTEPLGEELTTSVADGDSFRYYPAYRGPALDTLAGTQPQGAVAAEHRMQLLLVQRLDGSLTIGDTHEYDEPFAFDVAEDPYEHLADVASALLGGRCRASGTAGPASTRRPPTPGGSRTGSASRATPGSSPARAAAA